MPKENLAGFSIRLNLDNEQHMRIYKVLNDLNVDIHKSKNQFIVEALDFYIKSFDDEDLRKSVAVDKEKKQGFISRKELEEFKETMRVDVRNDIIQLLLSAIAGKQLVLSNQSVSDPQPAIKEQKSVNEDKGITDSDALSLITSWG